MSLYAERPEWSDVTPIPLPCDLEKPVIQILYSERFKDVYSYMAAIMKMKEYSERALKLTTDAIDLNTANYTVWHYRREILKALKCDLEDEFRFTAQVIESQPKSYQVWHHRRCLIQMTKDPSRELGLTESTLSDDAKNYHAWDHRQWVLEQYGLWDGEFDYIEMLLQRDLRNNSAWNHRYFVVNSTDKWNRETVKKELEYAAKYIRKAPNNESSWNYANGIIKKNKFSYDEFPEFIDFCIKLDEDKILSPFLYSTLADIYQASGKSKRAHELYEKLKECDSIREKYWIYKQNLL